MDSAKAFDKTWRNRLIHKLRQHNSNLPDRNYHFIFQEQKLPR